MIFLAITVITRLSYEKSYLNELKRIKNIIELPDKWKLQVPLKVGLCVFVEWVV